MIRRMRPPWPFTNPHKVRGHVGIVLSQHLFGNVRTDRVVSKIDVMSPNSLARSVVGVPVVASRVEGIPEAIRDNLDGLIFEPGQPIDLADKICQMVNDPNGWSRMSKSSVARQRSQLSARSMARGVARVYDSILG